MCRSFHHMGVRKPSAKVQLQGKASTQSISKTRSCTAPTLHQHVNPHPEFSACRNCYCAKAWELVEIHGTCQTAAAWLPAGGRCALLQSRPWAVALPYVKGTRVAIGHNGCAIRGKPTAEVAEVGRPRIPDTFFAQPQSCGKTTLS